MKFIHTLIYLLILLETNFSFGQQNKPATDSLYCEGHYSVFDTPKLTIFKRLIPVPDTLRSKSSQEKTTILQIDSILGVLKVRYQFICTYRADTTFDGKVIRDAVMKKSIGFYNVTYKIGDNIFTYVISGFQDSKGRLIFNGNPELANLYSCAQSEIWSRQNSILANSVLMKMKILKSPNRH